MMPSVSEHYGEQHQMFLQAMLSHGIMNFAQVKQAYLAAMKRANPREQPQFNNQELVNLVNRINAKLKDLDFVIKRCTSEHDGKPYYALLNRLDTSATRQANIFGVNGTELFKKALAVMFDPSNEVDAIGHISTIAWMNLVDSLEKRMTKKDAEALLNRMVDENWLHMDEDGEVYLDTRAVAELDTLLRNYSAINNCHLCNGLVTIPKEQFCENCEKAVHKYCMAKMVKKTGSAICPNDQCRQPWPYQIPRSESTVAGSESGAASQSNRS